MKHPLLFLALLATPLVADPPARERIVLPPQEDGPVTVNDDAKLGVVTVKISGEVFTELD